MGQILFLREEPHELPAFLRRVIAYRPLEHRVLRFERVEKRPLRDLALDFERHLAVNVRERPQVWRKDDPDHDNVCTSTDRTDGRSRTIASQLSPPSADP